ncbi:hypothetical protein NUW58_g3043 [Xylaria curta]|uniref:Uncharacterized protein n=1 Tax=Xylaria curta TaxID=42375 RepID=A0ACC1PEB6_9PEZI|nr:hypothetical protein NUW58_g3043 [Xylaria curta]
MSDDDAEYASHKPQYEADNDSDSASSSDEEENPYKKTKTTFDRIIADLKACKMNKSEHIKVGDFNLNDPSHLSKFFSKYESYLSRACTKEMNLLHYIAEEDRHFMPQPKKMSPLIRELVHLKADLLAQRDKNGNTPLFSAVANRNLRLVKTMCEAHSDVTRILKISKDPVNPQSTNCVHEAISNKLSAKDDDLIKFLIERADTDTLLALNQDGLTPLHLAVEHKRCVEKQVEIVEALIGRCDKALDKTYEHPKRGTLSPYLYLEYTHEEAMKYERPATENRAGPDKLKLREDAVKGSVQSERGEISKEIQKDSSAMKAQISEPQRIPQGLGEAPAGKFPSQQRVASGQGKKQEVIVECQTEAEQGQPHDDAVEFLYGMQQDKQIYFDLTGITPKFMKDRIESGLSHLSFEDILQYVAIPQVELEIDPVNPKTGQRAPKPNGSGRSDMVLLFNWLREKKGVKRILKVIVEDLQHPAHSDEAIETCLKDMHVETWDWKKHDLSPEVLHKVAPDVQVVHLYWGGNNAILRAWSEAEGLKKLEKLEMVYLHSQQGLETQRRTESNVKEFKARMSPIEVQESKMQSGKGGSIAGLLATTRDPLERHKWVTCMEEYAEFLQRAEGAQKNSPRGPSLLRHPITVALIDDGVDVNDQTLHSRIGGGRSFCHRDKEQNLNQSYYVSGGGHGTAMARLICKICPDVKLFVLRLDEYYSDTGKRQITAKSAAKAVRAAIEKRVDIISMSWTIPKTDDNKADIATLEEAISEAASRGILMFCAATDQAKINQFCHRRIQGYHVPGGRVTKKIFKIGAAEASGAALKWLGDPGAVDFIVPRGHKGRHWIEHEDGPKPHEPHVAAKPQTSFSSGDHTVFYCKDKTKRMGRTHGLHSTSVYS